MARALLILPTATYRAPEFLAAARALDIEVLTASEQPQALANVMAEHFLRIDLHDPARAAEQIVAHAAKIPIDAIVAVDDQGVLCAALASEALGLSCNPSEAVAATRDKAVMRERLSTHQVSQPRFVAISGAEQDLGTAVAQAAKELGCPVVVKPTSLAGSRGVIKADDPIGARHAAERIVAMCKAEDFVIDLLVESFVAGREVALEGMLYDGSLDVLAIFDKPDPLDGPYFEETIYVTPSRLFPEDRARVASLAKDACAALGLRDGPVHVEIRVPDSGEPVVIEAAARTIGGKCSKALCFSTGASLEELVLRQALHLDRVPTALAQGASGVMMLPIRKSGVLVSVTGRARARAIPGITGLEITLPPNTAVRALPEGDRYLGFLFARADDAEHVEAALRDGFGALEITIETTDAPVPDRVLAR